MRAESLRDHYDQQLRTSAEVGDADDITRFGPIWAATYLARRGGFVTYESLAADAGLPVGYTLERADSTARLREAAEVAGIVFDDDADRSERMFNEFLAREETRPGSFDMWLVRGPSGEAVCSGRVDFVDGTQFAGLWGGGCLEAHRGLGLYRALTAERARSALARGKRYLQSDCTEFSRPILERAGLVPVTTSTPMVWSR